LIAVFVYHGLKTSLSAEGCKASFWQQNWNNCTDLEAGSQIRFQVRNMHYDVTTIKQLERCWVNRCERTLQQYECYQFR